MNPLDSAIAAARGHLQATGLPVGPGLDPEEDERQRRRGGGGGSAGPRGGRQPKAGVSPRLIAFRPAPLVQAARAALAGHEAGVERKARLAQGAQPAVVKVASFAGGPVRVRALLDYLSRQGELAVEDETGAEIKGRERVLGLTQTWGDRFDGRAESRDVLGLEFRVSGGDPREAGEVVRRVAGDRPHAYSAERDGEELLIRLVVGVRSPGSGQRLPSRERALEALVQKSAGEGAQLAIAAQGHAEAGAARLLDALRLQSSAEVHDGVTGRAIADQEVARAVAADWAATMRPRSPRDTMHLVVSARAGTDRAAFTAAVRDYLAEAFPGHRYAFALHQDRPHLHAHAVVTMRAADGARLHPNITDFHAWRGMFSEATRSHGLDFTATRRHDRAAAPAYKMKHVRAVERGDALEATRRKVAAKRFDAIVPARSEQGRATAQRAAEQWRSVSASASGDAGSAIPAKGRVELAQLLADREGVDRALRGMVKGLTDALADDRVSTVQARAELDTIRETAAQVSARLTNVDARATFDSAVRELIHLVEHRVDRHSQVTAPNRHAFGTSAKLAGDAGSGAVAPSAAHLPDRTLSRPGSEERLRERIDRERSDDKDRGR